MARCYRAYCERENQVGPPGRCRSHWNTTPDGTVGTGFVRIEPGLRKRSLGEPMDVVSDGSTWCASCAAVDVRSQQAQNAVSQGIGVIAGCGRANTERKGKDRIGRHPGDQCLAFLVPNSPPRQPLQGIVEEPLAEPCDSVIGPWRTACNGLFHRVCLRKTWTHDPTGARYPRGVKEGCPSVVMSGGLRYRAVPNFVPVKPDLVPQRKRCPPWPRSRGRGRGYPPAPRHFSAAA